MVQKCLKNLGFCKLVVDDGMLIDTFSMTKRFQQVQAIKTCQRCHFDHLLKVYEVDIPLSTNILRSYNLQVGSRGGRITINYPVGEIIRKFFQKGQE